MSSKQLETKSDIPKENYAFYSHFENLKNSVYRQLTNARTSKMLLPSFYYNWFYTKERQLYNNLVKRQKLGPTISDNEVSEYNKLRKEFLQKNSFVIAKKTSKTLENTNFDCVYLKRERLHYLPFIIGIGGFAYFGLQLSRYWFLFSLIPVFLIKYSDSKFVPNEELESFYNYVSERRQANEVYNRNKLAFNSINSSDNKNYSVINKQLEQSYH